MFLEEYVLMKRKTKKPPYIKGGAKSKFFVGGVAEWEQSLSLLPGAKALRVKGFFAWLPGRAAGIKGAMRPSKSGIFILLSVSLAFLFLIHFLLSFLVKRKRKRRPSPNHPAKKQIWPVFRAKFGRRAKSGVFILLSVSFAFLSLFASFSSFFSREKKEKKKIPSFT